MPLEYFFRCPLPNGLHARPASLLQEITRRFTAQIELVNERTGYRADAKSVLSLMSADLEYNDPCRFHISGEKETEAYEALVVFIKNDFPHCDEVLSEVGRKPPQFKLPRSLPLEEGKYFVGRCVSIGIGKGRLIHLESCWKMPKELAEEKPQSPQAEMERFYHASTKCSQALAHDIAQQFETTHREILQAHLAILEDSALSQKVEELLHKSHYAVGRAINEAAKFFSDNLEQSKNHYLRQRALDLQDVAERLIEEIYGARVRTSFASLVEPSVILAQNLTPSKFLNLNRKWLQGLILSEGGETSHVGILARSFGIPMIVGITPSSAVSLVHKQIILDADLGLLITVLTPSIERYYERKRKKLEARQKIMQQEGKKQAITSDGKAFPIHANVSTAEEIALAMEAGAEGIGLFRTEMLFMDRDQAPSEEEQYRIYTDAAKLAGQKPVTIRTIDIGGDKPVSYLNFSPERNPFLGYRGIRLYREFSELVKQQMRAILRASAHGQIRIMFPMVSNFEEAQGALALFKEVQTELRDQKISFDEKCKLGLMLEVPSLAFCLEELCHDFDFFSIGSNDLLQYFFAVDRENIAVAQLASPYAPSFWRFLQYAAEKIQSHDCSLALCGEIGSKPEFLPLFVGLGFESISMAAPHIPLIKTKLTQLECANSRQIANSVMKAHTSEEVQTLVERLGNQDKTKIPLLEEVLVSIDGDAETKEEVIEDLVDLLVQTGRVHDASAVEDAIWQRESIYATGMEFGFAIPHCKSDNVLAHSIVFMRLAKPISWGGNPNKDVTDVVLLAIRASDHGKKHLQILAQLSRLMMRESFRESLSQAKDSATLAITLIKQLGIDAVG